MVGDYATKALRFKTIGGYLINEGINEGKK